MNLTNEERAKVAKLPTWARYLIEKLEYATEPAVEEAVKCRREAQTARERANNLSHANAALLELLGKAGQAGLDWAATVRDTLDGYEIFKNGESK